MSQDETSSESEQSRELSRRQFLRTAGLVGAGLALAGPAAAQAGGNNSGSGGSSPPPMPGQANQPPSDPAGTQASGPSESSRRTTGALGSNVHRGRRPRKASPTARLPEPASSRSGLSAKRA